jgi:hypothetical protein
MQLWFHVKRICRPENFPEMTQDIEKQQLIYFHNACYAITRCRSALTLASAGALGKIHGMRSPQDPGQRRRSRADVSPITGKVMLRPAGAPPRKLNKDATARTEARLAAILAALPLERSDKDE